MSMLQKDPPAYTVEEAARELRITPKHLYVLIGKKKGPPIKRLGRLIRIPVIAFNTWLNTPSKR